MFRRDFHTPGRVRVLKPLLAGTCCGLGGILRPEEMHSQPSGGEEQEPCYLSACDL